MGQYTDLAVEAHELWRRSAGETTALRGVRSRTYSLFGCEVTFVEVLDVEGAEALGKPEGKYYTVDISGADSGKDDGAAENAVRAQAEILRGLLRLAPADTVLVAGFGNPEITPDRIGPEVLGGILITRHVTKRMPELFSKFRSVGAVATGVLGTTGIESAELLSAVCGKVRPDCVIAVDALASASVERLCNTVQITDTGLIPGSGVGNARRSVNSGQLGVKVIAVGVPTVVSASALAQGTGKSDGALEDLFITPRDIDGRVRRVSKLIASGINLALHDRAEPEEIRALLS